MPYKACSIVLTTMRVDNRHSASRAYYWSHAYTRDVLISSSEPVVYHFMMKAVAYANSPIFDIRKQMDGGMPWCTINYISKFGIPKEFIKGMEDNSLSSILTVVLKCSTKINVLIHALKWVCILFLISSINDCTLMVRFAYICYEEEKMTYSSIIQRLTCPTAQSNANYIDLEDYKKNPTKFMTRPKQQDIGIMMVDFALRIWWRTHQVCFLWKTYKK